MADVDVLRAWANSTGSTDVVVAVIDSGVDYTHEDLSDNMWQNEIELNGVPGFDDDGNGYVDDVYGINTFDGTNDPMDELGHGTHIAGVIGATGNNGIGVVGLNWNIRILPCRFMNAAGSGRISGAVECLEYVSALKSRGVNIIATNNSWGGSGYSQTLYEAIREQPDILFVTAAGNHARDNDSNFFMPVNIDLPNVMAIASTDHNDAKTSTSGFGRQTVHLGAPGSSIFSTLPANTYWGDQYYGYLSGTSIAAPHVTGLAALVSARWPDARWQEIRNRILAGGDRVDSLAHNTITGRRANAYGALECEEQRVFSVLRAPNEYVAGMSALLRVLSIQCAKAKGRVTMTTASGEAVRLRDDGIFPDLAYSDGIYSAEWVPARPFGKMTFTSGIGKEVVITDTPVIISQSLRHATAGIPYSETVQAEGGLEPYGWEVGDGELPPGLNLNHDTGQIQGVPGQAGDFTFTLRLTDSGLRSSTAAFHLVVQQPANTLRILKAHYFARKGLLYIRVQSRHNEFANLEVEGLGPMRWNSRAKLWDMRITSLRPELAPRMVTVRGIEGTRSRRVMWVPRGRMFTKTVIQRN